MCIFFCYKEELLGAKVKQSRAKTQAKFWQTEGEKEERAAKMRSKTSNTLNKDYTQKHHPKERRKKKGLREGLEYPTCDDMHAGKKKKEKKTPFQGEKLPENFLFWVRVSKSKRQTQSRKARKKEKKKKTKLVSANYEGIEFLLVV